MIFKFFTFFTTRRPRSFEVLYPQSRSVLPSTRCTDAAGQALAVCYQEHLGCVAAVLIFSNRIMRRSACNLEIFLNCRRISPFSHIFSTFTAYFHNFSPLPLNRCPFLMLSLITLLFQPCLQVPS